MRIPLVKYPIASDNMILHHSPIDEIIKKSQEHLDAYLQSAGHYYQAAQWAGIFFSYLCCTIECGVGWASYGYGRCSVQGITGIFKFLLPSKCIPEAFDNVVHFWLSATSLKIRLYNKELNGLLE
jgi:hypothetical protein